MGPALPCPYAHLRSLVHKSIGGIGEEPLTASCPRAGSMRKVPVMWIYISLSCSFSFFSHLARSLPLPSNVNRPRIDLIMFVVNLHSKYR